MVKGLNGRWSGALFALLLCVSASASSVTVRPDRTTVNENESFNVDFIYSEEVRRPPNFDSLQKDFQIISKTLSSDLRSEQGRFSYEHSYTLTLMPRRTGTLELPSIRFDDVLSEPVRIVVKPAPATADVASLGDLYLEVSMQPENGYVQGQFIFTQRLYHRGWLAGGKLSPPSFGDSDAVVRQVEQAKRYSMFRDGERYQIYEQSYLVFPQQSGTLTADATDFTGQLREPGRPPRLKRVSASAVSVNVQGVPPGVDGSAFLPATSLSIDEDWPSDRVLEQGQPITRVIRITAQGLMAAQLQAIDVPEVDGLRVYADQPKRQDSFAQNGVTGAIEQSLALVPQVAGTLTLPAVEVAWWDVREGVARLERLPERVLQIAPSSIAPVDTVAIGAPNPVREALPGQAPTAPTADGRWPYWPVVALLFAALWLATLTGWGLTSVRRKQVKVKPRPSGIAPDKRRLFTLRNAVKKACDSADPTDATHTLIYWARAIWPHDPPGSLQAIAARLEGPAAQEVARLDAARYGASGRWAEPDRLWRAIAHIKPMRDARGGARDGALAAL